MTIMKNKPGEKTTASSCSGSKPAMTKQCKIQSEPSAVPKKQKRGRPPIRLRSHSSASESECAVKQRKTSPSKSPGSRNTVRKRQKSQKTGKDGTKSKATCTGREKLAAKRKESQVRPKGSLMNTKGRGPKAAGNGKAKSKVNSQKKAIHKDRDVNQFIDLWSLAMIGKREASLNATMKVNILYERQVSPKKAHCVDSSNSSKDGTKTTLDSNLPSLKPCKPHNVKKEKLKGRPEKNQKKDDKNTSHRKPRSGEGEASKKKQQKRKRKVSPYSIFEDEPASKSRKEDTKQSKAKPKKPAKRRSQSSVLRYHLGNIIERSPRQASLNAKAMIAMEQEEDVVFECASRTRVYDWTEVRPFRQNEHRKMVWMTGHGDPKYMNVRMRKDISQEHSKNTDDNEPIVKMQDTGKSSEDIGNNVLDNSIHRSMLKTIHEKGDSRLLKEYLRSEKEDFQGNVDVEKCPSPCPTKPVEKITPPPPSPKKKTPVTPTESDKQSPTKDKQQPEKERTQINSPAKPKPCRVATPIPQFPADQRATHMTSFVHHPVPQSFYQTVPQTLPQPQPQPIKVTPYSPNSPYIYQYSTDRQQQNLFVQNSSSPMQYGVENNDLPQRDYQPSSFSFNHVGSLSLGRRGLNPYHHQGNAYSPSIHLPVQAFGFNFHAAQYYQPPLQHFQAQQNLSTLQPVPIQQYPLVQQPMMPPHPLVQNLNQLQSYQTGFTPFPNMNSQHINQEAGCMPPPPPRAIPSTSSPQKESPNQNLMTSAERIIPISVPPTKCAKSVKGLESPRSPLKSSSLAYLSKYTGDTSPQKTSKEPPHLLVNFDPPTGHAFSRPQKHTTSIQVLPLCKKEHESDPTGAKNQAGQTPSEAANRGVSHFKVIGEDSAVSDILHSAHSTMFPTEAPACSERQHQHYEGSGSTSSSLLSSKSCQTPNKVVESEKNVRFSVSSILDMPTVKVKTEPHGQSCSKGAIKILQGDQISSARGPTQPSTFLICIPPPNISKPIAQHPLHLCPTPSIESHVVGRKADRKEFEGTAFKELLNNRDKVIVIDDSDSSDDEPLAKLVHSKPLKPVCSVEAHHPVSCQSKVIEVKSTETTKVPVPSKPKSVNTTKNIDPQKKQCKEKSSDCVLFTQLHKTQSKEPPVKTVKCSEAKALKTVKQSLKKDIKDLVVPEKAAADVVCKNSTTAKSDGSVKNAALKKTKAVKAPTVLKKPPPVRRRSKSDVGSQPVSSAVHGWSWAGEGELGPIPKLSQQKEERVRKRMRYKSMKHISGETISVKDCVILQSDGDGSAPYVAKVSALWENLNGDMMFSMLWYYQPEHTSTGRESEDGEQELFASKHREENSVACIDDKCYVIMYNEYCRMEAEAMRQSQGLPLPRWRKLIPAISETDRRLCRPLPPPLACLDNIWFCRYDYDIRKKIVRKPKHKKTDLRYRAPCKLV